MLSNISKQLPSESSMSMKMRSTSWLLSASTDSSTPAVRHDSVHEGRIFEIMRSSLWPRMYSSSIIMYRIIDME